MNDLNGDFLSNMEQKSRIDQEEWLEWSDSDENELSIRN